MPPKKQKKLPPSKKKDQISETKSPQASTSYNPQKTPSPKKLGSSSQLSISGVEKLSGQKRVHSSDEQKGNSSQNASHPSDKENENSLQKAPKKRSRKSHNPQKFEQSHEEVRCGFKKFKIRHTTFVDIMRLQESTDLLIPKLPFARLVREIMMDVGARSDYRIQLLALEALQVSSEMYLVQLFEDTCSLSSHANRITCQPKDMQLALSLRRDYCNK